MNLAPTAPGESNIKNIDLKNIDLFLEGMRRGTSSIGAMINTFESLLEMAKDEDEKETITKHMKKIFKIQLNAFKETIGDIEEKMSKEDYRDEYSTEGLIEDTLSMIERAWKLLKNTGMQILVFISDLYDKICGKVTKSKNTVKEMKNQVLRIEHNGYIARENKDIEDLYYKQIFSSLNKDVKVTDYYDLIKNFDRNTLSLNDLSNALKQHLSFFYESFNNFKYKVNGDDLDVEDFITTFSNADNIKEYTKDFQTVILSSRTLSKEAMTMFQNKVVPAFSEVHHPNIRMICDYGDGMYYAIFPIVHNYTVKGSEIIDGKTKFATFRTSLFGETKINPDMKLQYIPYEDIKNAQETIDRTLNNWDRANSDMKAHLRSVIDKVRGIMVYMDKMLPFYKKNGGYSAKFMKSSFDMMSTVFNAAIKEEVNIMKAFNKQSECISALVSYCSISCKYWLSKEE